MKKTSLAIIVGLCVSMQAGVAVASEKFKAFPEKYKRLSYSNQQAISNSAWFNFVEKDAIKLIQSSNEVQNEAVGDNEQYAIKRFRRTNTNNEAVGDKEQYAIKRFRRTRNTG